MTALCQQCHGSKKIAPMGGIQIDCPTCKGKGVMTLSVDAPIVPIVPVAPSEPYRAPFRSPFTATPSTPTINAVNAPISPIAPSNATTEGGNITIKKKPGRKPGWTKALQIAPLTATITE